jgi:hypothetical protein
MPHARRPDDAVAARLDRAAQPRHGVTSDRRAARRPLKRSRARILPQRPAATGGAAMTPRIATRRSAALRVAAGATE